MPAALNQGNHQLQARPRSLPGAGRPTGATSIPFEFADAAHRYGHSQIRQRYRLQRGGDDLTLFPDLIGFRPVPWDRVADWSLLVDLPGESQAGRARPIDGRVPPALLNLPVAITGDLDPHAAFMANPRSAGHRARS
jgi:hypothetical protein